MDFRSRSPCPSADNFSIHCAHSEQLSDERSALPTEEQVQADVVYRPTQRSTVPHGPPWPRPATEPLPDQDDVNPSALTTSAPREEPSGQRLQHVPAPQRRHLHEPADRLGLVMVAQWSALVLATRPTREPGSTTSSAAIAADDRLTLHIYGAGMGAEHLRLEDHRSSGRRRDPGSPCTARRPACTRSSPLASSTTSSSTRPATRLAASVQGRRRRRRARALAAEDGRRERRVRERHRHRKHGRRKPVLDGEAAAVREVCDQHRDHHGVDATRLANAWFISTASPATPTARAPPSPGDPLPLRRTRGMSGRGTPRTTWRLPIAMRDGRILSRSASSSSFSRDAHRGGLAALDLDAIAVGLRER